MPFLHISCFDMQAFFLFQVQTPGRPTPTTHVYLPIALCFVVIPSSYLFMMESGNKFFRAKWSGTCF
jgi:hypothetical protein